MITSTTVGLYSLRIQKAVAIYIYILFGIVWDRPISISCVCTVIEAVPYL